MTPHRTGASLPRRLAWLLPAVGLAAGCGTTPRLPDRTAAPGSTTGAPRPGDHEGFLVAAHELDTWNAVGQPIVRTDGIRLDARSEMLDLHVVQYRGQDVLLITRGVPLQPGAREPATRVLAIAKDGAPTGDATTRALLDMLQRELPEEIARIRALQAPETGSR